MSSYLIGSRLACTFTSNNYFITWFYGIGARINTSRTNYSFFVHTFTRAFEWMIHYFGIQVVGDEIQISLERRYDNIAVDSTSPNNFLNPVTIKMCHNQQYVKR